MIYGSVCSGIEAATTAWHPLGWKASFFSEIEKFPRAVLQHKYPETPLHGDFTTIEPNKYEPINLLVGGTPCQSFSIAGLRGGMADERGNLALEYLKLAQRLRPQWLVWENVPGVLSSNKGRDFGAFLGGLAELRYGFAYRVLDAQYFGVPQRRRRVFVVGYLGDWRTAAAVLFERESLRRNPAPRRKKKEEVAPTLMAGATSRSKGHGARSGHNKDELITPVAPTMPSRNKSGGGMGTDFDIDGGLIPSEETSPTLRAKENHSHRLDSAAVVATEKWPADVAATLNAAFGDKQGLEDQHALGGASLFVPDIAGALTAKGPQAMGAPEVDAQHYIASGIRSANTSSNGKGIQEECTHTLDQAQPHAIAKNMQVRRLTPIECERLQGFPDNYTQIPWRKKDNKNCPDGPRYKALGNSMAVPVMTWIGQRIEQVEKLRENNEQI